MPLFSQNATVLIIGTLGALVAAETLAATLLAARLVAEPAMTVAFVYRQALEAVVPAMEHVVRKDLVLVDTLLLVVLAVPWGTGGAGACWCPATCRGAGW